VFREWHLMVIGNSASHRIAASFEAAAVGAQILPKLTK
jgi:hypothetical protein